MNGHSDSRMRCLEVLEPLGQQLCLLRLAEKLSLEDLAGKTGLNQIRLGLIETGEFFNEHYLNHLSRFYHKKIRIDLVD